MPFPSGLNTILQPPVPFTGSIPGGVECGSLILVTMECLPQHMFDRVQNRFAINLARGSSSFSDILLHVNGRPDYQVPSIVFNSQLNKSWGQEEVKQEYHGGEQQAFLVAILVAETGYKIGIDGVHIHDYEHRADYKLANTLQIQGNIQVKSIEYVKNGVPSLSNRSIDKEPEPSSLLRYFLSENSCIKLPELLTPGQVIYISGFPGPTCSSFSINLQVNDGANSDIIFHLNPRFLPTKALVCNSKKSSKWGAEENMLQHFCFSRRTNFDCHILCEHDQLQLALNCEHFFTFRYRQSQSLKQVRVVKFMGDCLINELRVN